MEVKWMESMIDQWEVRYARVAKQAGTLSGFE
jgi:hypothetical protein